MVEHWKIRRDHSKFRRTRTIYWGRNYSNQPKNRKTREKNCQKTT